MYSIRFNSPQANAKAGTASALDALHAVLFAETDEPALEGLHSATMELASEIAEKWTGAPNLSSEIETREAAAYKIHGVPHIDFYTRFSQCWVGILRQS